MKVAELAPAGTVNEAGIVTALLLLARLTENPPEAAAAFSVAIQLSVPDPVIELFAQLRPDNTGTPAPLRLIKVEVPLEELLVMVNEPETAPAAVGSNSMLRVAV